MTEKENTINNTVPKKSKKMKKIIYLSIIVIFCFCLLYLILGYLNSFIGYYGYNKHKIRRFSNTLSEAKTRKTFINQLAFTHSTIKINHIFIERGYKWGSSEKKTVFLSSKDSFAENNPQYPYQLIIEFDSKQNNNIIAIPKNRTILKTKKLEDTIETEIFIRDNDYHLKKIDTIKIWN